ncbi:hypothetical protein ACFFWC_11370 [Plantactinospora siamensis]|uniref:Uncharacterized protein n=1 Tax=Plantactinospora siamensis TaxID=555372 RepID=A0ABV6P019_9ACTN
MSMVHVLFVDGPAGGGRRELPAEPDGSPPPRWVLSGHDEPGDHLYERAAREAGGGWTMRYVRTYPAGITQ